MSKQDDAIWLTQVRSFHRIDDWMADYDPDEVGQYLTERGFYVVSSGRYTWLEADMDYYPIRGDFILWKYDKNHPGQTKKELR